MEKNERPRMVSQFEHENALMHYGAVNRRSMIMLIAVCVTCVLMAAIFAVTDTIRDREWQKMFTDILSNYTIEAQEDGVHEFADP